MALNSVTVTGNLPGAAGATVIFTPSAWLTDATDAEFVPPIPIQVTIAGNGKFSVSLLATDNAHLSPSWTWTVNFVNVPSVAPKAYSFPLLFANGATQDITALTLTPL